MVVTIKTYFCQNRRFLCLTNQQQSELRRDVIKLLKDICTYCAFQSCNRNTYENNTTAFVRERKAHCRHLFKAKQYRDTYKYYN